MVFVFFFYNNQLNLFIDFSSWWNSSSIWEAGKRAPKTDLETSVRIQGHTCFSPGRHTKASSLLFNLPLNLPSSFFKRVWSIFWRNDSVRILQKSYLVSSDSLVDEVTTPDISQFGYNNNTIRIERSISCQSGNTRGRKDKKRAWVQVTDEKLPCQKKLQL